MRTFHLLKTPDILLANDIGEITGYYLSNGLGAVPQSFLRYADGHIITFNPPCIYICNISESLSINAFGRSVTSALARLSINQPGTQRGATRFCAQPVWHHDLLRCAERQTNNCHQHQRQRRDHREFTSSMGQAQPQWVFCAYPTPSHEEGRSAVVPVHLRTRAAETGRTIPFPHPARTASRFVLIKLPPRTFDSRIAIYP
jgi:hypothetical protein